MKLIMMIALIGGAAYLYNQNSTWTPERKNREIERAMKQEFNTVIRDAKKHPGIKDATIKHDKKGCGIVVYVKMREVRNVSEAHLVEAGKQMKSLFIYAIKNAEDKDTEALRYVIRKGIYVMYRFYLSNGRLIASFKITERHIRK